MRFRSIPNGDLFVPQRGKAPEAPKGYCQDSGNPFLYHPILDACDYRVPFNEKLGCGRIDVGTHCDLFEKVVTGTDCKDCPQKLEDEPLLE